MSEALEQEISLLKTRLKQAITKGKRMEEERNEKAKELEAFRAEVAAGGVGGGAAKPSQAAAPDAGLAKELDAARERIRDLEEEKTDLLERLELAATLVPSSSRPPPPEPEDAGPTPEEEVDLLRSALESAAERIRDAVTAREEVEARLQETLDRADKLASDLTAKGRELSELRQRVGSLEGELSAAQEVEEGQEKAVESLRRENEAVRREADNLQGRVRALAAESDQRARRIQQLEKQLLEALQAQASITLDGGRGAASDSDARRPPPGAAGSDAVAEARTRAAEAEARLQLLAEAEEQARLAKEHAEGRVAVLEGELSQVRAESDARAKRFLHLQSSVGSREKMLQEKVDDLEVQLAAATSSVDGLRDRALSAEADARDARASLEYARRQFEEVVRHLKEEGAEKARQAEEEVKEAVEAMEAATLAAAARKKDVEARLIELEVRLREAEARRGQASLERDKEVQQLRANLEQAERMLEEERATAAAARAGAADGPGTASLAASPRPNANVNGGVPRGRRSVERHVDHEAARRISGEHVSVAVRADVETEDPEGMDAPALREVVLELRRRLASLKARLESADKKVAAAAAVNLARIASLEKKCQELQFLVAYMEAGGGGAAGLAEDGGHRGGPAPHKGRRTVGAVARSIVSGVHDAPLLPTRKDFQSWAGIIGLLLRYRRGLAIGYLLILHAIVYSSLTGTAVCRTVKAAAETAAQLAVVHAPGAAAHVAAAVAGGAGAIQGAGGGAILAAAGNQQQ